MRTPSCSRHRIQPMLRHDRQFGEHRGQSGTWLAKDDAQCPVVDDDHAVDHRHLARPRRTEGGIAGGSDGKGDVGGRGGWAIVPAQFAVQ